MPELSRFYGLVIKMFFRQKEHDPPHIHVQYGEYVGSINIHNGELLEGDLPSRAYSLVKEWHQIHKNKLLEMWNNQQLHKLPPLE